MTVLLSGPIDTQTEAKAILDVLQQEFDLKQKLTEAQINVFLEKHKEARRLSHIIGSVDTPAEVVLFLHILKAHGIMFSGAVDTPAEATIFMLRLQQQGHLTTAEVESFIQKLQRQDLLTATESASFVQKLQQQNLLQAPNPSIRKMPPPPTPKA